MKKTYRYYCDPSHGWLAVPMADLKELGLAEKISGCSYYSLRTDKAYLEEDCDMTLFTRAAEAAGWDINYRTTHAKHQSSIRLFSAYPSARDWREDKVAAALVSYVNGLEYTVPATKGAQELKKS